MNTNANAKSSNARWSAIETTTRMRSSDRLRKLLIHHDLGRSDLASSLDSPSNKIPIPAIRRTSFESLNDSMSTMSSISSMSSMSNIGSLNSLRFTQRKNSSSKLLRYNKKDSMNSLLSLNSRWKSTPPKKKNSSSSANSKLLPRSNIRRPMAVGNHRGRWMATLSSDNAIDRPISAIRRKESLNAILPSSVA